MRAFLRKKTGPSCLLLIGTLVVSGVGYGSGCFSCLFEVAPKQIAGKWRCMVGNEEECYTIEVGEQNSFTGNHHSCDGGQYHKLNGAFGEVGGLTFSYALRKGDTVETVTVDLDRLKKDSLKGKVTNSAVPEEVYPIKCGRDLGM